MVRSKGEKQKEKSVREKYVAIEVKNRGKKHFITTVEGLNNFSTSAKTRHRGQGSQQEVQQKVHSFMLSGRQRFHSDAG